MSIAELFAKVLPCRRSTDCRIVALVAAGYLLVIVSLVGHGWFSTVSIRQLREITRELRSDSFAVSNAARDIKIAMFRLRNDVLEAALLHDVGEREPLFRETVALDRSIHSQLAVIRANFQGDMAEVQALESKLYRLELIRGEIFEALRAGELKRAELLVREEGTPHFNGMVPLLDYVQDFADRRAEGYAAQAEERTVSLVSRLHLTLTFLLIFLVATALVVIRLVLRLQQQLHRQATIDCLTDLPNRRHFLQLARQELARFERYSEPAAFALVDLDFFKQINDTFGHQAGDRVLQEFSAICRSTLRVPDLTGRIGGEEFAILFPNTTLKTARPVLERLRKTIETAQGVLKEGQPVRFTASFGLTVLRPGDDLAAVFKRADEALYAAKENGRNRIWVQAGGLHSARSEADAAGVFSSAT